MKKKADLAGIVGGIIGTASESAPVQTTAKPKRSGGIKMTQEGAEIRATFIVQRDLVRKIKYIGLAEQKMYKDVINSALASFVTQWENTHGKIELPDQDV